MCRLRDEIDRILARDQAGRLIVAIETALDDKRYEVRPDSIRVCWHHSLKGFLAVRSKISCASAGGGCSRAVVGTHEANEKRS